MDGGQHCSWRLASRHDNHRSPTHARVPHRLIRRHERLLYHHEEEIWVKTPWLMTVWTSGLILRSATSPATGFAFGWRRLTILDSWRCGWRSRPHHLVEVRVVFHAGRDAGHRAQEDRDEGQREVCRDHHLHAGDRPVRSVRPVERRGGRLRSVRRITELEHVSGELSSGRRRSCAELRQCSGIQRTGEPW